MREQTQRHDNERRGHHAHGHGSHDHENHGRGHHHHPAGGSGQGPGGERHGRGGEGGRHGGGRHGGPHGRGGPHDREGFDGPRGRARRGEARYVLLDALRDGPKHGYEIIKTLEEKSGGQYVPSPGTVYPTMQFLEDQGLVRAEQEAARRVFRLTEAGQAELDAHAEELADFWARFAAPAASAANSPEIGFLQEELDALTRTIWGGLRSLPEGRDETLRRVRQAVEGCRNDVRAVLAGAAAAKGETDHAEPNF